MTGIDVSHHQGIINWQRVKSAGVEFALIKAGGSDRGTYTDECFESNYRGAKSVGIHVGSYYFVGANCTSKADGIADAKRFAGIIKGKQFDFPVYIDIERTSPSAKAGATEAAIGFCEYMESQGYYCGIYASDISGFKDRLDLSRLDPYDKWVARYGSKPVVVKKYGIWQHSETGHVPGISGNVDLDECYVDYPTIMKTAGKNGYTKPEQPTVTDRKPKYIPDLTAADVSIYLAWCAAKGAGNYEDTEDGFDAFLSPT